MRVVVTPETGRIQVDDSIRFEHASAGFDFVLNSGLDVTAKTGKLRAVGESSDGLRRNWRLDLETPDRQIELQYHGQPRFSKTPAMGGMPRGILADRAVYLDGASAWYPQFDGVIATARMHVELPDGWLGLGLGRRETLADGDFVWTSDVPHDQLYLIAGRYTRYAKRHADLDLSVWLLQPEPALAELYLAVMGDYIDHYSRLIGDYPYPKFAVVENPWQTGYGMPSFTLLGSQVIRLPFIPYTSLPHEILHNWWGNGVWVDYAMGNWSEGLTAYLADHWMQERENQGAQYRLRALQRYSNFAATGADLPLLEFVSRHDDASQSIGYSKSLMLFHMLRESMGDQAFVAGLRNLWRSHRFARIGFLEALDAITVAKPHLRQQMRDWVRRSGAPDIMLSAVSALQSENSWQLSMQIDQRQAAEPFTFDLPVVITLRDHPQSVREKLPVSSRSSRWEIELPAEPLRVDVDPEYDVMRYLDPSEQPPALNRLFGGTRVWLVVPDAATPQMRQAWSELATAWQKRYRQLQIIEARSAAQLPADGDRIILGWDNALIDEAREAIRRSDQQLADQYAEIGAIRADADRHAVVLVNTAADGRSSAFIAAPDPAMVRVLARKLPHYGSYGRLIFDGDGEPILRETLTSTHSRLTYRFTPDPVEMRLPARDQMISP